MFFSSKFYVFSVSCQAIALTPKKRIFKNTQNYPEFFCISGVFLKNEKNHKNPKKHEKSKNLSLFLKVFDVFKKLREPTYFSVKILENQASYHRWVFANVHLSKASFP